jgi:hypothetical protein
MSPAEKEFLRTNITNKEILKWQFQSIENQSQNETCAALIIRHRRWTSPPVRSAVKPSCPTGPALPAEATVAGRQLKSRNKVQSCHQAAGFDQE